MNQDEAEAWEQAAPEEVTAEHIEQAREELLASGYSYSREATDDGDVLIFDLPEGIQVALPAEGAEIDPDEMSPMIGGGVSGSGFYITFNSVDQRALASGSGAALGVAICAIPGIGWAACAVTSFIIGAGIVYVNAYGVCPNSGTLRIDSTYAGTVTSTRCV